MTSRLTVDDLQLVEAAARHGSLGAAAKELLLAQPSASRRLAALERRLGTQLFDRDTTGARATPAGRELARHAARVLADLDALPDHVLAAVDVSALAVGTIQALSPMVFTALDIELAGVVVQPEVDHGPVLLRQVHEGSLDAAIVTIGEQTAIPHGLLRSVIGVSPLVVVLPEGSDELAGSGAPSADDRSSTARSTSLVEPSTNVCLISVPSHGQGRRSRRRCASLVTCSLLPWCLSWPLTGTPHQVTGSSPARAGPGDRVAVQQAPSAVDAGAGPATHRPTRPRHRLSAPFQGVACQARAAFPPADPKSPVRHRGGGRPRPLPRAGHRSPWPTSPTSSWAGPTWCAEPRSGVGVAVRVLLLPAPRVGAHVVDRAGRRPAELGLRPVRGRRTTPRCHRGGGPRPRTAGRGRTARLKAASISRTLVPWPVPRFHVLTGSSVLASRVSAATWPAARSSTWM